MPLRTHFRERGDACRIFDSFDIGHGRKLDQAGVDVVSTRYNNQIHDFGLLNGIRDVPSTQDALRQANEAFRKYLNP